MKIRQDGVAYKTAGVFISGRFVLNDNCYL